MTSSGIVGRQVVFGFIRLTYGILGFHGTACFIDVKITNTQVTNEMQHQQIKFWGRPVAPMS